MIWVIGLGGALGALSRYLIGVYVGKKNKRIPLATFLVNVTGSILLGILYELRFMNYISEWLWTFGGIGFCGAFTTFSTFGFEVVQLIQAKKIKQTIFYVGASVVIGFIGAAVGIGIVELMHK